MSSSIPAYIARFIILLLVQVLILKNVYIYPPYIHLYIYPLFIFLLPFRTPTWATLLLAFFLGLCVDMFYDSLGLHTATLLITAYARKFICQGMEPRGGFEVNQSPIIRHMGLNWFLQYASILLVIHLFFLFLLEELSFANFGVFIIKLILSFLFSMVLIVIYQYLTNPKA